MTTTSPEPLKGSILPQRKPARLLGSDEVESLLAQQEEDEEEVTEDDRRPD